MDDIVKQAMAKWPNVPDCYGWLGLDARGDWYLRDAAAQAARQLQQRGAGRQRQPRAVGQAGRLHWSQLRGGRARGCWYFQNGPQRVYLELAAAPWVLRLQLTGKPCSCTRSLAVQATGCWMDESGLAYLPTRLAWA